MKALHAVAAFLLCACGTSLTYVPTNAPPHAMTPRDASSVQVFLSGKPDRSYAEVGMIEAQNEAFDSSETVFAKMRARAGELGCEGVILLGPNDSVVGDKHGTTTLKGYRGVCIVFTDAASPTTTTASQP